MANTNLQLRSLVGKNNTLELSLADVEIPNPAADEIVVRVDATPLNPSDLAAMFALSNIFKAKSSGTSERPVLTVDMAKAVMPMMSTRLDQSLTVGIEGAGVVIAAGESPKAQALMGKVVSLAVGEMYTQYRCVKYSNCLPMPSGVSPAQAASWYVNPLTASSMVENMRMEGHTALVHTAAASNLGQMLNRICIADGVGLVNIVRKQEQEDLLRDLGAKHVVNSSAENFLPELTKALIETGATIAFDAIGGGNLGDQILSCMEAAAARSMPHYNHYGSAVHKQLYIYGGLDRGPTVMSRQYGFAWSTSAWLLTNFIAKAGKERVSKMQARIAAEITTTFATHYSKEVSLAQALSIEEIAVYAKQKTGDKYLINPQKIT